MIETFPKLNARLLAAAVLSLAAACNVSASGQIPCVDDSSCPATYPVCKAGFCAEGAAGANGNASVAVLGVPGKNATDPLRGTIQLQVVAKASSGVKSISLAAGTNTYAPATDSAPPIYIFSVDTTKLADGPAPFTATVTPGDTTQQAKTSAALSLTIDNTPPTFSSATLTAADLKPGATIGVDVTVTDAALASVSGTVQLGSTPIGSLVETSASGTVHHLALALAPNAAAGTYTLSITAVDKAGNTATIAAPPVTVYAPFTLAGSALLLAGAATESLLPAVSAVPGKKTLTATLTVPGSASQGINIPAMTLTNGTVTRPAVVTGGTATWTGTYLVDSNGNTDSEGIWTFTATVTDLGGNSNSVTHSFLIDKTGPTLVNGIPGIAITPNVAGPQQGFLVTFATGEALSASQVVVKIGTTALVCDGSTTWSCGKTSATDPYKPGLADGNSVTVAITDVVGNKTGPLTQTYTLDTTQPAFSISAGTPFTVTETENKQTCSSTTNTAACNLAVTARNTEHLVFAGTATKALGSASMSTDCQPGSCGMSTCAVSGAAFTCTLLLTSAATNSGDTASISLTDTVGNAALSLAAPTFRLDNTAPLLGSVTVSNPSMATQTSPISARNGQQLQFVATASKSLSAATIGAAGIGTGSCSISGSGASTQVNCLLTVNDSSCGSTACTGLKVVISITDTFGNATADAGTEPAFTVDNVAPTLGALTVTNLATGLSGNPVSVRSGQQLQLQATAGKSLSSAVIQAAPSTSSGGCSLSGSGAGTVVTCLLSVAAVTLPNSGCTTAVCAAQAATIRLFDLVGNPIAVDATTPNFTIDNVTPAIPGAPGAIAVTNQTNTFVNGLAPVPVAAGQVVQFATTANKAVSSATVTVGTLSNACSIAAGTAVTCQLTVPPSGLTDTHSANLVLTDPLGASSANIGTNNFVVDTAAPAVTVALATTAPATSVPGTAISITFTLQDTVSGLDTRSAGGTHPAVTVGPNSAALISPADCASSCTPVTTARAYTYSYTFTGGETTAATIPVTATFQDALGNSSSTSLSLQVDLVAPQIANFGANLPTFNRAPGGSATVSGNAQITAGNGTTSVCAFDTLSNALVAASCASAGALATASVSTSGAGVISSGFTTSNIADTTAQPFTALHVRAFSRGNSSSVVKTAQTLVSLGFSNAGGTNLSAAQGVRSVGSAQPAIPLTASNTVELASFTQATAQAGAAEVVGQWEATSTTNTATPPTNRARVEAAYDASNRKLMVLGGMDTTGAPVADAKSYKLDMTTTPPTWTSFATGAQVDTTDCTFGQKALYDGSMTYAVDLAKYVVHGGRCLSGTGTTIVLPAIYNQADAEAGGAWTDLAATNEFSAQVGIQGAMFSFANTSGTLKGLVFNFGFNDASNFVAQTAWRLEQVTTTSPTWSNPVTTTLTNRYGANMVGDSGQNNLFIFGGIQGAKNSNHVSGGSARNDTLKWDGASFATSTTTNSPSARAYSAMALQTQSSNDGAAASSFLMYGGTGAECSASPLLPNFGASCGSGSALDDLYELNAAGSAWTRIFTDTAGVAGGIGRTSAEKAGSVTGFFDTNRFYVYRPGAGALNAFPLFHTPRVVLTFDSSAEPSLAAGTLKNLQIQLTAGASEDDTGTNAAAIGVKIYVWNGSAWGAAIAAASPVNVNLTTGLSSIYNGGKTLVLVEPFPVNVNYNYKSLTISAPSATWTVQTP